MSSFVSVPRTWTTPGRFWSALGVELQEHTREDYGLRILYGWNSGVEIITSKGAGPFADQINAHLAEHGPGIFSVVYGVPSIADAVEQVRQAGADAQIFETPMVGDEPWFDRYDHLQEGAVVGMDDLRLAIVEKRHREEIPSEAGHVSHVMYVMDPDRLDANARLLEGRARCRIRRRRDRYSGSASSLFVRCRARAPRPRTQLGGAARRGPAGARRWSAAGCLPGARHRGRCGQSCGVPWRASGPADQLYRAPGVDRSLRGA